MKPENLSTKRQREDSQDAREYEIGTAATNQPLDKIEHSDRVLEYMNCSVLGNILYVCRDHHSIDH